jgi:hypothetical protein
MKKAAELKFSGSPSKKLFRNERAPAPSPADISITANRIACGFRTNTVMGANRAGQSQDAGQTQA